MHTLESLFRADMGHAIRVERSKEADVRLPAMPLLPASVGLGGGEEAVKEEAGITIAEVRETRRGVVLLHMNSKENF